MPPTNAQLRAKIDRPNQAMANRSRDEGVREWLLQIENACRIKGTQVEDAIAKLPGIAGSVMEKPASGSSYTGRQQQCWSICSRKPPTSPRFESSNYQAAQREKLLQLKQTADIEMYNGEYRVLIFRVEGMSELGQVLNHTNGLKPCTRAYVKLEKSATLSAAMDFVLKYEVTHFVDEARVRQDRSDKKKTSAGKASTQGGRSQNKPFRAQGRFKARIIKTKAKGGETRACFYCKKPGHIRSYKASRERQTTPVNEGPAVVKSVARALKVDNVSINVLCENPLVYKSSSLFSIHGEASAGEKHISTSSMLLDRGATTIYVPKTWVEKNKLTTMRLQEKNIRVKLGDNQIAETDLKLIALTIKIPGVDEAYKCVAVIYAIPDEFDCIPGIKGTKTILRAERTSEAIGPIEEGGPAIASGSRRSAGVKSLSAKSPDSCRGAALETDAKPNGTPRVACEQQDREPIGRGSAVGSDKWSPSDKGAAGSRARAKSNAVEKMFRMGVVDAAGVETKFITRKKVITFLRIKAKNQDKPEFVMALSNETIKPCLKAQLYLDTDWETFRANPAYNLLKEYKDTVFRPELPEDFPEKREIEHQIDVRDPNLTMYRHLWRQLPEQQREIVRWVEDMVEKKLVRPSINSQAAPTFCVRKPVGWRIVHDYRYLNSNTIRQRIPMTSKEDILDDMAGAYYYSTMDLMSAYYQVRMRKEDIKFTAFQVAKGLWEYLQTRSFCEDIYIFIISQDVNEHLEALRKTLDILRDNKLYFKLSKCVFCTPEIPCLGDFVGRDGVPMDPDKVQYIKG
ncbi:LOW QUALITY PROTEIN: hypothetical protein PHMEG_00017593 [Phytophthora megakarya]|uniref:Reverse transcriptase domain-containing protein n=1 Tax=Phytophthora megakarya TaxID=4795 RepID=A0A225VW47_9STRA|nr:LOW QUALITY PROTEIN: hypothetical protein PHMEG_00017593 [Phytophthora megakarya]